MWEIEGKKFYLISSETSRHFWWHFCVLLYFYFILLCTWPPTFSHENFDRKIKFLCASRKSARCFSFLSAVGKVLLKCKAFAIYWQFHSMMSWWGLESDWCLQLWLFENKNYYESHCWRFRVEIQWLNTSLICVCIFTQCFIFSLTQFHIRDFYHGK